jgi:transposase
VLSLPPSVRLFVATQPVDGRKGPDSLMALVRDVLRHDPLSGHLFIFFSKRCDRVRIVYWDRNGFAMWTEKGRFRPTLSTSGRLSSAAIEAAELALIVEGIDLRGRVVDRDGSPPRWLRKKKISFGEFPYQPPRCTERRWLRARRSLRHLLRISTRSARGCRR